jgi:hypothetical protein
MAGTGRVRGEFGYEATDDLRRQKRITSDEFPISVASQ